MNLLTEAIIADQQRIHNFGIIAKRIGFALEPWKPGRITMYVNDQFRFTNDVVEVVVEVELLPDLPCVTYPQLLSSEDEQVWLMADQAFKHFRYRPSLPVDDHIVLGED